GNLEDICIEMIEKGDYDKAIEIANLPELAPMRNHLIDLFVECTEDPEQAMEFANLLKESPDYFEFALAEVSRSWACIGKYDKAIEIKNSIDSQRDYCSSGIVEVMASRCDFDEAKEVASSIINFSHRNHAHVAIFKHLLIRNKFDEATELVNRHFQDTQK